MLTPAEMVPAEFRASGVDDYGGRTSTWKHVLDAWDARRVRARSDAPDARSAAAPASTAREFKNLLAERFDIQVNKTSRNSVLLQTNINNTRSDVAHLLKVLADLARRSTPADRAGRRASAPRSRRASSR